MSVKIILNGCSGRMGQVVSSLAEKNDDVLIVAGIDKVTGSKNSFPVFKDIEECDIKADVIIDFSLPEGNERLMDYAEKHSLPVVLCTTGLSEDQLERVKKASEKIAVLRSANMSLGINTLMKVLSEIAPVLSEAGFDIEIVEKHHREKKDAPSGTALALADCINSSLNDGFSYVYDRSRRSERRPSMEIGISAVRGGTIPGDHDIIFAGEDETVTISHRAYSRRIFGNGAIKAAVFLKGKDAGMYSMADVIK